jgi:hypothetical protein
MKGLEVWEIDDALLEKVEKTMLDYAAKRKVAAKA